MGCIRIYIVTCDGLCGETIELDGNSSIKDIQTELNELGWKTEEEWLCPGCSCLQRWKHDDDKKKKVKK